MYNILHRFNVTIVRNMEEQNWNYSYEHPSVPYPLGYCECQIILQQLKISFFFVHMHVCSVSCTAESICETLAMSNESLSSIEIIAELILGYIFLAQHFAVF